MNKLFLTLALAGLVVAVPAQSFSIKQGIVQGALTLGGLTVGGVAGAVVGAAKGFYDMDGFKMKVDKLTVKTLAWFRGIKYNSLHQAILARREVLESEIEPIGRAFEELGLDAFLDDRVLNTWTASIVGKTVLGGVIGGVVTAAGALIAYNCLKSAPKNEKDKKNEEDDGQ